MSRKKSYITVTDQFCGAGGSSCGAQEAGVEISLALNHWKQAIETHQHNFQNTLHECTDISACDPRRYPSTDGLITSPECTNHTVAKGVKSVKSQMELYEKLVLDPSAERSRATMWDVPRFAEVHSYNFIIVENVVQLRKWVMYESWLHAMTSLGYLHKVVYHNSMHSFPTPQSRDRMYVVFWKKGNKKPNLEITPKAWCEKCNCDVSSIQSFKKNQISWRYKQGYVYCCPQCSSIVEPYYYAAFNAIDWSNMGRRIGDRKTPLAENTINRIKWGLDKYKNETFIVNDQHSTGVGFRVKGIKEPLGTLPTVPHFKLVMPFITLNEHTSVGPQVRSVVEAIQTQATRQTMALVHSPWIIEMNSTGEAKPSINPLSTLTAGGINHAALHVPMIIENKGKSNARSVEYQGIITTEAWNSFVSYNRSQNPTHITEALQTIATKEQLSIINYKEPTIDDCYYRMLTPLEVKRGMAFNESYEVLGNAKEQVKQLGNAVNPPVMKMLVERCKNSL